MAGWTASWRAALRIARREAARHKGRSLLVAATLALPAFGVAAGSTLTASSTLTTAERTTRVLGAGDAWMTGPQGVPLYQSTGLAPDSGGQAALEAAASGAQPQDASQMSLQQSYAIRQQVLPNAQYLPERLADGTEFAGPGGYSFLGYYRFAADRPAAAGIFDPLSGRLPRRPGEIALTAAAARQLGATLGSTVTLQGRAAADGRPHPFTVVGTFAEPDATADTAALAVPAAAPAVGAKTTGSLVIQPGGISWAQVQALDRGGWVTASRRVVLDPPPAAQVPYDRLQARAATRFLVSGVPGAADSAVIYGAIVAIAVTLALLEVVLLAGPAFAVGAKRRQREYALVGAIGADRPRLRRLVLAEGLVLGTAGAALGAGLGVAAGAAPCRCSPASTTRSPAPCACRCRWWPARPCSRCCSAWPPR